MADAVLIFVKTSKVGTQAPISLQLCVVLMFAKNAGQGLIGLAQSPSGQIPLRQRPVPQAGSAKVQQWKSLGQV